MILGVRHRHTGHGDTCDLDAAVKSHRIILALCGDWADNVNVYNNPAAFKNAYWDIASLSILSPTSSGSSKRHHYSHKPNYF
ncbi:hypothetical protein M407DRAFT_32187 [Tulasnella calospora MUT 4182]|nr:hypothetical protein M407DRAFT_32187 [Tulasnella calospora MUT 4182]